MGVEEREREDVNEKKGSRRFKQGRNEGETNLSRRKGEQEGEEKKKKRRESSGKEKTYRKQKWKGEEKETEKPTRRDRNCFFLVGVFRVYLMIHSEYEHERWLIIVRSK